MKYFSKLVFSSLVFVFLAVAPSYSQAEDIQINHANTLEILDEKLILKGNVSVSTVGEDSFTLLTTSLISTKNAAGEFSRIECFGRSKIVSDKFILEADKIFFNRSPKTKKFSEMDSKGNVVINSKDGTQKVKAPKVIVDLQTKKLYASQGVSSEQIREENGKKQKVTINSEKQEINLAATSNNTSSSQEPTKQLIATGEVDTVLEDQATVYSDKAELYTLNDKAEKAVFTGNANLKTTDGTEAEGKQITYDLKTKSLEIDSSDDEEFFATKGRSKLKVPFEDNGQKSEMIIEADVIVNQEKSDSQNVLTAHQISEDELVELTYGTRKAWGRQLFINQNKLVPNKKDDYLILVDKAKILDTKDDQLLEAPVIRIGLGQKDMHSGFTGRASGSIPMKKKDGSQATIF